MAELRRRPAGRILAAILVAGSLGAGIALAGGAPQLATLQEESAKMEVLLALEARRRQLDAREQDLDRREIRLKEADEALSAKIAQMAALRTELDGLLTDEKAIKEAKYKEMAVIHTSMPTARSAEILGALDDSTAIRILGNLTDERVAKTLAKMKPERALTLSQAYLGIRKRNQADNKAEANQESKP